MKSVPAKKARTAHPRRRDNFGVAVRNTNPRRIRRYARLVEIVLPPGDFVTARHEKAAGDHASGEIRVRKRIRVEILPAPVGPFYRQTGVLSVKNETQEPVYPALTVRPLRRGNA
jgi:hypothetical protein